MDRVSVVVCSYKPDASVLPTVRALLDQQGGDRHLEIVLVVHAPAPEFAAVREEARGASEFIILEDPGVGLSHARNIGISQSAGELVAFLDDTAVPEAGWLTALENAFAEQTCDSVGGDIVPVWDQPLPRWFDPFLEVSVGAKRAMARGFMAFPETPFGANMAFRRTTFARSGLFDENLGRRPGSLLSNEEVALCYRVYETGGRIFYEPSMRVRHKVPGSRMNRRYARVRSYWQGVSRVRMYRTLGWPPPPLAETILALAKHSSLAVKYVPFARHRFRSECIALMRAGELVEDFNFARGVPNLSIHQAALGQLRWRP